MIYHITYDLIIDGHSRLYGERDIFICPESDKKVVKNLYKERLEKRLTPWQEACNIRVTTPD